MEDRCKDANSTSELAKAVQCTLYTVQKPYDVCAGCTEPLPALVRQRRAAPTHEEGWSPPRNSCSTGKNTDQLTVGH
jgi:hypothetical protein